MSIVYNKTQIDEIVRQVGDKIEYDSEPTRMKDNIAAITNINFMSDEQVTKLSGLVSSKFTDVYPDLASIPLAGAESGMYAIFDSGIGNECKLAIYDRSDDVWREVGRYDPVIDATITSPKEGQELVYEGAVFVNKDKRMIFDANNFRLDSTEANQAIPEVINGDECHTLIDENILHVVSKRRLKFYASTVYNLSLTVSMDADLTGKKKRLVALVYDSSNTLIRTVDQDDIVIGSGTAKQTITIDNIVIAGNTPDFATDDNGRIEFQIKEAADASNRHTGSMHVFDCEVIRV